MKELDKETREFLIADLETILRRNSNLDYTNLQLAGKDFVPASADIIDYLYSPNHSRQISPERKPTPSTPSDEEIAYWLVKKENCQNPEGIFMAKDPKVDIVKELGKTFNITPLYANNSVKPEPKEVEPTLITSEMEKLLRGEIERLEQREKNLIYLLNNFQGEVEKLIEKWEKRSNNIKLGDVIDLDAAIKSGAKSISKDFISDLIKLKETLNPKQS